MGMSLAMQSLGHKPKYETKWNLDQMVVQDEWLTYLQYTNINMLQAWFKNFINAENTKDINPMHFSQNSLIYEILCLFTFCPY